MLHVNYIMNSPVEEIFAFRSCCGFRAFDQNLEFHLKNTGSKPIVVPSRFDLEGRHGIRSVDTLMPAGDHEIGPGETVALYCHMDEVLWQGSRVATFYDTGGNRYPVLLHQHVRPG